MPKIAISIGDINGVGLEIALNSHESIKNICQPIYFINKKLLIQGAKLLNHNIPDDFEIKEIGRDFKIKPSIVTKKSGEFSYASFVEAVKYVQQGFAKAVVTLPINKNAWSKAGISYKGHTDALDDIFKKKAIMMIGCEKLFVALFTHHIRLKDVPSKIKKKQLVKFMLSLESSIKEDKIGVLALNPHASDGGIMGDEEEIIKEAINSANKKIKKVVFEGPLVPDTAFVASQYTHFVCMYHDQGLIAVKSLYFDESINVSLNLPIIRTSVDHGTAFDIAYKFKNPNNKSYINAVKEAIKLLTRVDM